MKRVKVMIAALMALAVEFGFGEVLTLENGFSYTTDAAFKVGEWNTQFNAMKEKADAEHIPLVVFWANPGCGFCSKLERALGNSAEVKAWMKKRGYLFCFGYGTNTKDGSAAKAFSKHSSGEFPYCAIYWYEEGMSKAPAQVRFSGRTGNMPAKGATLEEEFMNSCEKYLSRYVSYQGGSFGIKESEGNRLEADPTTTALKLKLTRDEDSDGELSETVVFAGPDSKTIKEYPIKWTGKETEQTLTVEIPAGTFKGNGERATLTLKDAEDNEIEQVGITGVSAEVTAYNPLWIGERVASEEVKGAVPTLAFGEWTMDLEVAQAKVAAAKGEAYTLAVIEGSLWCPDCQATEKNFLSLKDREGVNRFEAWAKANQVALVAIDVPRFETETTDSEYPTLLSREVRTSKNLGEKSGLGYLTRKGVSDEDAETILERNRKLVSTDVAERGFHVGTDSSEFRTGVPCFVLLRKDGTVAARLTRWWTVAPTAAEQAKWDNFIKRFDEMLAIGATSGAHADKTEVGNNAPAGAAAFAANGGEAKGELSHVDTTDVFILNGVGGNALQKVSVKGASAAEVTVALGNKDATGKFAVIKSASGKLNAGIELEHTFTQAGDYYVRVEAKDVTSAAFAVDSATAENFHAYTIAGDVVLVPQQDKATGAAPANSDEVVIRLVKDGKYRLEGIDANAAGAVLSTLSTNGLYFTALQSGDATLKLSGGKGAKLSYQQWAPGSVGFTQDGKTVQETVGQVVVPFERTGGKSGEVKVNITVNTDETNLYDFWGDPRFEFVDTEFIWKDGEQSATNVVVGVKNDKWYDGAGKLVLDLAIAKDENGDTQITKRKFTLTVNEDEKQSPGRAAVVGAEPYFARNLTVYAKQSAGATIRLARVENFDGLVGINVTASDRTVEVSGGKGYQPSSAYAGLQTWGNRDASTNELQVANLPAAGKSVKLTLTTANDYKTFKPKTGENYVTIMSVDDDALAFASPSDEIAGYRYVDFEASYPLASAPTDAKKVSFTKLYGTLPAGLKIAYDANENAMALTGIPTAKAGVYRVVYQVKEGTLAGLTKELVITLVDPTDAKNAPAIANTYVATARTLKDLPVVCAGHGLIGTVQLTVPTKGNVSARYVCEQGTIPFTTKGWAEFEPDSKNLTATLTSTKAGYTMTVVALGTGDVDVTIVDPNHDSEELRVTTDGRVWSAKNPAADWKGYYTAALEGTDQIEATEGLAPRGYGYLTLKMDTVSAANSGKVTWAGALPNGTAISGSSVLSVDEIGRALVPIFKASSTEVFGILPTIEPGALLAPETESHAEIKPQEGVKTFWKHKDRNAVASFEADFKIYGGYYDPKGSLEACCEEQHNTKSLRLNFAIEDLCGWTAMGIPAAVRETMVEVGESTVTLEPGYPYGLSIKLTKATGVVTGKVLVPVGEKGKTLSATWKGIVVTGWGEGCGCGETIKKLPFIVGAYTISDSIYDETTKRTVAVKRGGKVEASSK